MNPFGSDDATPRYGNGNVNKNTAIGTDTVDARDETTADEILRSLKSAMLYPMFTITNNRGNNGAPSHPFVIVPMLRKQAAPSFR